MKKHLTQLLLLIAFVILLTGCATKPIRLSDIKRVDKAAKAIRGTWIAQDFYHPDDKDVGRPVGNPYKLIFADKGHCQRIAEGRTQDGRYHVLRSHIQSTGYLLSLSFTEGVHPGTVYWLAGSGEVFHLALKEYNSEGKYVGVLTVDLKKDVKNDSEKTDVSSKMSDLVEPSEEALTSGTPLERFRYKIIRKLNNESFDDLVENLNEDEPYDVPSNFLSGEWQPNNHIEIIFGNRRFVKLREELSRFPAEEAARKANEILDRMLLRKKETLLRVIAANENPEAPRNTVSVHGNKYALCAAVCFVGDFAQTSDVVDGIKKLEEIEVTVLSQLESSNIDPSLNFEGALKYATFVRSDFKLSLLLHSILRNGENAYTPDGNQLLAQIKQQYPCKRVKNASWDSDKVIFTTEVIDSATLTPDRSSFLVFDWPADLKNSVEKQNDVIQSLMDLVISKDTP